jgi:hypothetical protein
MGECSGMSLEGRSGQLGVALPHPLVRTTPALWRVARAVDTATLRVAIQIERPSDAAQSKGRRREAP